jgi:hypothetical protein
LVDAGFGLRVELISPLPYLYKCRTDPNENTNNEEVFYFWSVLRLLLGNKSEAVFPFWSVPRLLPEEQKDNSFVEFLHFLENPEQRRVFWLVGNNVYNRMYEYINNKKFREELIAYFH